MVELRLITLTILGAIPLTLVLLFVELPLYTEGIFVGLLSLPPAFPFLGLMSRLYCALERWAYGSETR